MTVKSGIFEEKVWKSGKNRGFGRFFKGKSEFWGVWGIKSRVLEVLGDKNGGYFAGFPLIRGGGVFWAK